MEGVQLGQGEDVGGCVAPGEGPGGRLAAAVPQAPLAAVLGDRAGHLLAGEAADLGQKPPHQALAGLAQAVTADAFEGVGDEGVSLLAAGDARVEGPAPVKEGADLAEGGGV